MGAVFSLERVRDEGMVSPSASDFLDDASTSSSDCPPVALPVPFLPIPDLSPGLHFSPSDYQISTPTSRASPKTPPPEYKSAEGPENVAGVASTRDSTQKAAGSDSILDAMKERTSDSKYGPLVATGALTVEEEQEEMLLWAMD